MDQFVQRDVRLLVLGDLNPALFTHQEAQATLECLPRGVEHDLLATDAEHTRELERADCVWAPPGSPYRDDGAVLAAIGHCVERRVPYLGTCSGFHYACMELARRLAGVSEPAHAETDPDSADPVIVGLACTLYGERRQVRPVAGTRLAQICGDAPFEGFHFCGYGLEPSYAERLQRAGLVLSAHADDAGVEAIELPDHPFFIATAFQPQVGAGETHRPHALITALLEAAAR